MFRRVLRWRLWWILRWMLQLQFAFTREAQSGVARVGKALVVAVLAASAAQAQPGPDAALSPEIQVNVYTTSSQQSARVAAAADGTFVVVWQSIGVDGDSLGVIARRVDDQGLALGAPWVVNTQTSGVQNLPDVASAADGSFVVVWESPSPSGFTTGVFAQRFDGDATPLVAEFQVNGSTLQNARRASVDVAPGGEFVVAWESSQGGATGYDVFAQRFDSAGAPQGSEFQLNTYTTSSQRFPKVAMDGQGGFVAAWDGTHQAGTHQGIFAQRFDSFGAPLGGEFQVDTYTAGTQSGVDVASDAEGNFVVVWTDFGGADGSGNGARAQRYDFTGAPLGGEIQVNTYTTDSQGDVHVTMDPASGFFVTWTSDARDGDSTAIAGQRFDRGGTALGDELQINTYTPGPQGQSDVAVDSAGNLLVSWRSRNQDGNLDGVFAQRLQTASVGDRVFRDSDLDGVQSAGEAGVAGVPVHLYDDQSTLLRSMTTDVDGAYAFPVVPPGSYFVDFELPAEYDFAASDVGANDELDSDADPGNGETATFTLGSGEVADRWDAGLVRTLGDRVWLDDGDGIQQPGEPGAANVMVRSLDASGNVIAAVETDSQGFYRIDAALDLDRLEIVVPTGFSLTLPNVGSDDGVDSDFLPSSGQTASIVDAGLPSDLRWDAGLVPLSVIAGQLWFDEDENGVRGPSEPPLGGLAIRLLNAADEDVAGTVADEQGGYVFTGIADGSYRIAVDFPDAYRVSPQDVGADDTVDSDLDALGRSALFVVNDSEIRDLDGGFGLVPPFFADGFESGTTGAWSATVP